MVINIDGPARLIELDNAATDSIRAIYSRWVDWVAGNEQYLPAFPPENVIANPPTVPVYVTLANGWKVRCAAGAYTKKLFDGFLYTDDLSDPIAPVASGTEPRIVYENPVIAVGFSAGSGLSAEQADMLIKLWQAAGFDPDNPLFVPNGAGAITIGGTAEIDVTGDCETGHTLTARS